MFSRSRPGGKIICIVTKLLILPVSEKTCASYCSLVLLQPSDSPSVVWPARHLRPLLYQTVCVRQASVHTQCYHFSQIYQIFRSERRVARSANVLLIAFVKCALRERITRLEPCCLTQITSIVSKRVDAVFPVQFRTSDHVDWINRLSRSTTIWTGSAAYLVCAHATGSLFAAHSQQTRAFQQFAFVRSLETEAICDLQ